MPSDLIHEYMRIDHLPHIWCAGCGNGTIMRDVAVALDELITDPEFALTRDQVVIVSGIGCSSRAAGYMDFNSIHTTGNHLIHAARRNIGLTVICFDNLIYGMTGGQYSPVTPHGDKATTAPYGNVDRPFDVAKLAEGAGASYTARGDIYHVRETIDIIKQGI